MHKLHNQQKGAEDNLAKCAVKNQGIFLSDSLDQVGKLLREGLAGEMQRATYVRVIAPLFIPLLRNEIQ